MRNFSDFACAIGAQTFQKMRQSTQTPRCKRADHFTGFERLKNRQLMSAVTKVHTASDSVIVMGMDDMTLPHPDDPAKQHDHLAVLDLVPIDQATHVAII